MTIPEKVILVLTGIILIPTLASITRFDKWWIRFFDFPRIQISITILMVCIASVFIYDFSELWHFIALGTALLSLFYQANYIYPYTPLSRTEVLSYDKESSENHIAILVSNVLTPNKNYGKLISLIHQRSPDLVLTLESDKKWEKELEVIEKEYPYTVKIPQDNLYGMHLYSKLELEDIEVKYLVQEDIPSIHGFIKLEDGSKVEIHCLHPRPPSPTESDTSTNRDAELLLVGENLKENHSRTLVFGDLNDVAWSRTTQLFQKVSGLLDPRIGRGFFNTFHAGHRLLRWPLDHAFHSEDFTLVQISREASIGSDHFPMFIKLNLEPKAANVQEEPEADAEEEEWAQEKIEKGEPLETSV